MTLRIGHGYDAHRFAKGRKLIIGGVQVPYNRGLEGHSDADVLSHAIADALLGAAGLGDIGAHFPDNNPAYKDISSLKLLEHVASLLAEKGGVIVNLDSTVVLQEPKLAPYIQDMRLRLAGALNLSPQQVSVKATTTEGMGFTGGEGAAAYAVCLVEFAGK